ncbi:MAG TPA: YHYH protein [Gammaproteobacteria bacterium]|nr:YHYH protein [Gammaproteobacteria bacterium]
MKVSFLAALSGALVLITAFAVADSLPLGDGKVAGAPRVGYLYSCLTDFSGHGAAHSGPWIQGDTWTPSDKPAVQGAVSWPNSSISISLEGGKRVIRANDLPKHTTGTFPIQQSDPAYQYDHNPNSIRTQDIVLSLPADPSAAAAPGCLPMGIIGFALTGAAIFDAVDAAGRDAVAHEVQDHCNGHPQHEGQYHYHGPSPCMRDDAGAAGRHSDLIGYALDGYGIYGEHGEGGKLLHDSDLDACHGHTHAVMWDGKLQVIYHYHLTPEYPYTLGCFHGSVDPSLLQRMDTREGQGMSSGPQGGHAPQGRQGPHANPAALTRAADILGISADRLRAALGPPPPDFAKAAATLGIGEDKLRDAMRKARQETEGQGDQGQGAPPSPPS